MLLVQFSERYERGGPFNTGAGGGTADYVVSKMLMMSGVEWNRGWKCFVTHSSAHIKSYFFSPLSKWMTVHDDVLNGRYAHYISTHDDDRPHYARYVC
eukprot:scaffold2655_cov179-Amphora_coffeaeformis.AAC.17